MEALLTLLSIVAVGVLGGLVVILVLGALLAMGAAAMDEGRHAGRD